MVAKIWNLRETNDRAAGLLQKALGGTRKSIYRLLVARGLDDYQKVENFFKISLDHTHSPWLMKDMEKATDRIIKAIDRGETILLFGDYDVDGTTSISLMYRFLSEIYDKEKLIYYIPDRYREGYGLNRAGIDYAVTKGASLIITVDCGITSKDLISEASARDKVDFIVCDHHLPPDEIPPAAAILNPKQQGCTYPFKELCACGVCFKLARAIAEKFDLKPDTYLKYIDLLLLATTADVVPILDENRIFCHFGLIKINRDPYAGIKSLVEASGHTGAITMRDIGFGIAPIINAAGRIDHATTAVELFITDNSQKAGEIAETLVAFNKIRKDRDKEVQADALQILKEQESVKKRNASVVYKEDWHHGVLGIVASRLIESYYRPTIVLTDGEEYLSGSARSIPGYNIYNAIDACKEYLIKFGGHEAAAGLTIARKNLLPFSKKFEEIVARSLLPEVSIPVMHIDIEIELSEIDSLFFNTINRMRPFGHKNPTPVFLTKHVQIQPQTKIVAGNHVRLAFRINEQKWIYGIAFNQGEKFMHINRNTPIDIVYNIEQNNWKGRKSFQLRILDFRTSDNIDSEHEIQKIL